MGADRASCPDYGFIWAFRDPVVEKWEGDCTGCKRERRERAKEEANQKFIEQSQAYPHLRNLSAHDDDTRQRSGRPRFDRTNSDICIPPGWTSAMNRRPCNANEFEHFVRGRFNPLIRLPDTHIPPQDIKADLLYHGPRPLPPPRQRYQSQFQPEQHAFTQQINAADPRPPPQGYRSRAPPPGYTPQIPSQTAVAQYTIARHERARLTPPLSSEDLTLGAIFESDDQDKTRHMPDRRRPSYAKTHGSIGKGWVPPTTLPLPPKQETDTAPPSRSMSVETAMAQLGAEGPATSHSLP